MVSPALLIVDDDEVVRQMLPSYFVGSPFSVVGTASSGSETLSMLGLLGVDVILTDMRMPGMDGVDLIREIRCRAPHIPVVGITSFDEDQYVIEFLRAGASGIILKSAAPGVVVDAVTMASEGKTYIDPALAGRLQHFLRPVTRTSTGPTLTTREQEVLDLLLQGKSNRDIAKDLSVTVAAVKKHVGALFDKFSVDSRLKLVIVALQA
ncbi:MAG TPA: response regulator transcription factor [Corynebacterium sp.]|nr:response regulator transcription factor [Corynebacterium sp.]